MEATDNECYWIWTDEVILHSFHPITSKSKLPQRFDSGEIVFNGIAKDDIRGRVKKHLFGLVTEGMSAMGVDLLTYEFKGSRNFMRIKTNIQKSNVPMIAIAKRQDL